MEEKYYIDLEPIQFLNKAFDIVNEGENKDITRCCSITSKEAKEGTVKKEKIIYKEICNNCKGLKEKCVFCDDRGFTTKEKEFILNIPPHTKENNYFEFIEQGNKVNLSKKRGNIYFKIHIFGKRSNRKGKKINE